MSPAWLVYLTDLVGTRFPSEPAYPVIWAKLGASGYNPPFGEMLGIG